MTLLFKAALRQLSDHSLYLVLEDINRRIGNGYLSDNESYLADQTTKAEMVKNEIEARIAN